MNIYFKSQYVWHGERESEKWERKIKVKIECESEKSNIGFNEVKKNWFKYTNPYLW